MRDKPSTPREFMERYPRTTGHIIAESMGYATPTAAARIGLDGLHARENCCEWIYACYRGEARRCLQDSIRGRHNHKGFMSEYSLSKKLVENALKTGEEPLFASWF